MCPLGALFFGAYVDKHGRRARLILTLALMSLGTVSIAVVPGYAVIGVAALARGGRTPPARLFSRRRTRRRLGLSFRDRNTRT